MSRSRNNPGNSILIQFPGLFRRGIFMPCQGLRELAIEAIASEIRFQKLYCRFFFEESVKLLYCNMVAPLSF